MRVKYTGKNGILTTLLKKVKELSLKEKTQIGIFPNEIKGKISELIDL